MQIRTLVQGVLEYEGHPDGMMSIVFIEDTMMIELNTQYLNHRYTTDVLSFTLSEEDEELEGEVYINVAQAKRQAQEYNVSLLNEVGRLVVHGVLHVLGYEDDTARKKQRMHRCEDYYLGNLGLDYFHA